MARIASSPAAPRRAAAKSRPRIDRRAADPRFPKRLPIPPTADTILYILQAGLADVYASDAAYFRQHSDLEFRLRPAFQIELCALGYASSGRPFLPLPRDVTLFVITPRGARIGIGDLRFIPNASEFLQNPLPIEDGKLGILFDMAEPASAFVLRGGA